MTQSTFAFERWINPAARLRETPQSLLACGDLPARVAGEPGQVSVVCGEVIL
jgi:hypothetical protein